MRNVGVSIPIDDAAAFQDVCERLGVSGADVLRPMVYEFIEKHQDDSVADSEEPLPLTG